MTCVKFWSIAFLIGVAATCIGAKNASAQVRQEYSKTDSALSWEQKVLKKSTPLKWQASPQSLQQHRRFEANQVSYNGDVFDSPAATNQPAGGRRPVPAMENNAVISDPVETQFEPMADEGVFAGPIGCANHAGMDIDCDGSDPCNPCCDPCVEVCDLGWEVFDGRCGPLLRGISIFAGVDAFKGPLDRGTNGNFGFNEGINMARPLGDPWGCGYQIGANFVQSDFSGTQVNAPEGQARFRRQYFATAGIFRRADPCRGGFQYGIAYDYLHDVYYLDSDLQQIRSETGFVIDDIYEIGYYGVYGVATDRTFDGKLDPTDMFCIYARRKFENGGDGRIWGGATGNGDGLLGADLWVPLGRGIALENRINYLIPKGGRDVAQPRESWGLVIQLVWYPGHSARCEQVNPYRPLFNVADNSLFMVDRLTNH